MHYHALGKIPPKRHTQFRKPDGGLYLEELFSTEGFSDVYSLLYHCNPPTQIKQIAIRFKGTQALLGDGPTHTRGNKTQFNNITTLNYDQSPELNKMPTP